MSVISGHVDDFLFAGQKGCPIWQSLRGRIHKEFDWQAWEEDNFTQCGVSMSRNPDGSFDLSEQQYVESIPEIQISREQKRQRRDSTVEAEKSQFRGLLVRLAGMPGKWATSTVPMSALLCRKFPTAQWNSWTRPTSFPQRFAKNHALP